MTVCANRYWDANGQVKLIGKHVDIKMTFGVVKTMLVELFYCGKLSALPDLVRDLV